MNFSPGWIIIPYVVAKANVDVLPRNEPKDIRLSCITNLKVVLTVWLCPLGYSVTVLSV